MGVHTCRRAWVRHANRCDVSPHNKEYELKINYAETLQNTKAASLTTREIVRHI